MSVVKNRSGFTIIEVLISMVLLSFVMLGVISITNNSVNTKDKVIAEDNEKLQVEIALNVFEWDFSQIYTPLFFSERYNPKKNPQDQTYNDQSDPTQDAPYDNSFYEANRRFSFPNEDGLPIPIFKSENKSFEFFTISNRRKIENSNQSQFAWVKYALESDDDKDKDDDRNKDVDKGKMKLVRYFVPFNVYDGGEIDYTRTQGQTLLRSIEDLSFEFWDDKNKKFVERLTEIEGGENLVRGVKLTLTWKNLNGIDIKIEKIFRSMWPYHNDKLNVVKTTQNSFDNINNNGTENKNAKKISPDIDE